MKKRFIYISILLTGLSCGLFISCVKSVEDNPIFDNSKLACPFVLTSDTNQIILKDYFPDIKKKIKVKSAGINLVKTSKINNDTLLLVKKKNQKRLTTIDIYSDIERGTILIENRNNQIDSLAPFLITSSSLDNGTIINVEVKNAPATYFVFWQNTLLDSRYLSYNSEGSFQIELPQIAKKHKRSYIRVFAYNSQGISNDLLIPLSYRQVISDPEKLNRKDPQTQILYSLMIDRFYEGSFSDLSKNIQKNLDTHGYHKLMFDNPDTQDQAAGYRKIDVTDKNAYKKLIMLQTLNFTMPRVPCIYYGDEFKQLEENNSANNLWEQSVSKDLSEAELLDHVKNLTHLRRSFMPLLYGDYLPLLATQNVFIYMRIYLGQYVIVALNKSEQTIDEIKINLPLNLKYEGKSKMTLKLLPLESKIIISEK